MKLTLWIMLYFAVLETVLILYYGPSALLGRVCGLAS
jgi:hypothetical protein